MSQDPSPPPRLHPETAPIFRAAAGRPFTGEELDEICRVFPDRAGVMARMAELWEAASAAPGPVPAGGPSPRAFRAELAALGQATISGEKEALSAWHDRWRDKAMAAAWDPLLRRLGRAWAKNALLRLHASSPDSRRPDGWTLAKWVDWLHGWLEKSGWGTLGANFSAAADDGVLEFVLQPARGDAASYFWAPLHAGFFGEFGSRLSGANLDGVFIGDGLLDATLPIDRGGRGVHGRRFLVTSPARAAEAGAMAAAGLAPEAVRTALRRTKPLPVPDPAATGGAP